MVARLNIELTSPCRCEHNLTRFPMWRDRDMTPARAECWAAITTARARSHDRSSMYSAGRPAL
jgi:hypothetical protein